MDVLFLISIGCFFALFVAALAIARRIRVEGLRDTDPEIYTNVIASPAPSRERIHLPAPPRTDQDLHSLAKHKQPDWRFLVSEARRTPPSSATNSNLSRKPPASARSSRKQRFDWAYVNQDLGNQDLGDLSDPYVPTPHNAPTSGTYTKNR